MSITPVGNDSYVVTGESQSGDGDFRGLSKGKQDIFVMKIDGIGNIIWLQTFGGSGADRGVAATSLPDGSVIVAGTSNSKDGMMSGMSRGGDDIVVFKLRANGDLEWKQVFGGSEDDRAAAISTDRKRSIYITGFSASSDGDCKGLYASKGDAIVIRQSLTGNRLWIRKYGGSRDDWASTAVTMDDGGVFVAGETYSKDGVFTLTQRGMSDMFAMRIDSVGQLVWLNSLGGSGVDRPLSSVTTPDNHLLITGCTTSDDGDFERLHHGKEDIFVFNLDQSGNLIWKSVYGGSGFDWGTCIAPISANAFVMTGYTNSKDGDFISRASIGRQDHDDALILRSDVASRNEEDSPIRMSDETSERDAERHVQRGSTAPLSDFSSSVVLGGSADDWVSALCPTNDCGVAALGYSSSTDGAFKKMNEGGEDAILARTDIMGNIVWSRSYGGSANDRGVALSQAPDGGFFITGHTNSSDRDFRNDESVTAIGDLEVFVIKTDEDGRQKWMIKFGGPRKDRGQAIIATRNGGAVVAGNTNSDGGIFQPIGGEDDDMFISSVDGEGSVWWANTYGGSDVEWVATMSKAHDSGYVVVGYTKSNDRDFAALNKGKADVFVMKLDMQGRKEWVRTYGGSGEEWGLSIVPSAARGYIITGFTTSNDGDFANMKLGQHDAFVLNIDERGFIVWKQVMGGTGTDVASAAIVKPNGEIVVTGHTTSNDKAFDRMNKGQEDSFITVLDAKGKIIRTTTIGGSANDRGVAIASSCDTGFVIAVQSFSNNGDFENAAYGQCDMQILHLNSQGSPSKRGTRR
jgi:ribosomal protein S11